MNSSLMNETLAALFCLLISWSFSIWVFFEWHNYEAKKRIAMAIILSIAVALAGTVFPFYYLCKCYYHYVLHHLRVEQVQEISIADTVLTGDLTPIVTSLNKAEWYVPNEQDEWSNPFSSEGVVMLIKEKSGRKYKFKVGYYFLGEALVRFPTGGYALSHDLPRVLEDKDVTLPSLKDVCR